jgi:hypothetical protein
MLAIPGSVNPLYTVDRTVGQIQFRLYTSWYW